MGIPKALRMRMLREIVELSREVSDKLRTKKAVKKCETIIELAEYMLENQYCNTWYDCEMDDAEAIRAGLKPTRRHWHPEDR